MKLIMFHCQLLPTYLYVVRNLFIRSNMEYKDSSRLFLSLASSKESQNTYVTVVIIIIENTTSFKNILC